jgi:DMSO/TMAO reductase YedYZ molybdopterin-dependent catalytic subunit
MSKNKIYQSFLLYVILTVLLSICAIANAGTGMDTFTVSGNVKNPQSYSVTDLQHEFTGKIKSVSYSLKGIKHKSHIIPLQALINSAKPNINPHIKHALLQAIVTVTGRDGYTVVFSMGELSSLFGNEPVWVALDYDGKPLDSDDGPVELIVPGDIKAGRWVHSVESITIAASQP